MTALEVPVSCVCGTFVVIINDTPSSKYWLHTDTGVIVFCSAQCSLEHYQRTNGGTNG